MENEMRRAADEIARRIEKELRGDPQCPRYILAGLDTTKAVKVLQRTSLDLVELCYVFMEAEDEGRIREIEQYAKLVTTGIRQYLAAIQKDGAP